MDVKSLFLVSVVVAWQVVPLMCQPYPNGTPMTVTQSLITSTSFSFPVGTPSLSSNSPSTTTSATSTTTSATPTTTSTAPNITSTAPITTSTINLIPASSTIPISNLISNSSTTSSLTSTVTSQISKETTSEIWKTYYGYMLLNSNNVVSSQINQQDLESWLESLTKINNKRFKIQNFKQVSPGKSTRRKRNVDQTSHVTYEVGTNSIDFYQKFKEAENLTSSIKNFKVEKAYLWQKDSNLCPDSTTSCEDGKCRINDTGTFYCEPNNYSDPGNKKNLLGLIAIPCIIIFILAIILIVYLVRRYRKEKQKQDITKDIIKIRPPVSGVNKDEYVDTATKRSLEGFNSVKSSNFEYENGKFETGLY